MPLIEPKCSTRLRLAAQGAFEGGLLIHGLIKREIVFQLSLLVHRRIERGVVFVLNGGATAEAGEGQDEGKEAKLVHAGRRIVGRRFLPVAGCSVKSNLDPLLWHDCHEHGA